MKQFNEVSLGAGGSPSILPVVQYDGNVVARELRERNIDRVLFGDNDRYRGYDADAAGELIGTNLTELGAAAPDSRMITINDVGRFANVNEHDYLPLHFEGSLSARAPATLAIAVNGIIAGVTKTFIDDGRQRVDTVLIPGAFRNGRNVVKVFVLTGSEGNRFGHELRVS